MRTYKNMLFVEHLSLLFTFFPIRLALGARTYSVQKHWSNGDQSSPDLGFLGVVPRFSGSSGPLDLGFLGFVLLCFALLRLALFCLCSVSHYFAVLCLAKLI